jgi:hypothetical protein
MLSAAPAATWAQDDAASEAPEASGWLGAVDEVYRDGFDEAPDWLDLGEDDSGRTSLEGGRIFMSVNGPDANYWDAWVAPAAADIMRVEATIDLDKAAGTGAGVACGASTGLPRWFVAGVNNADEWWLGRLIDGRLQVVERGDLAEASPSTAAVRVAIECAVVEPEGGDHAFVTVDGRPVSSTSRLDIPVGPYDKAALLIASDEEVGSATYDDMLVQTGEEYEPRPSEADATPPSE